MGYCYSFFIANRSFVGPPGATGATGATGAQGPGKSIGLLYIESNGNSIVIIFIREGNSLSKFYFHSTC